MNNLEKERQAVTAMTFLKEFCSIGFRPNGKCNCLFCSSGGDCLLRGNFPKYWESNQFSQNDIMIAKALKAYGACYIGSFHDCVIASRTLEDASRGDWIAILPREAFGRISNGQIIKIDDIISKESGL